MGKELSGIDNNQYVLFKLEKEYYGLNIHQVKTIERVIDITRVPNALDYIEGVMNLRGDVVPVINLRKMFLLPEMDLTEEARIIIVSIEDITVGLLVDSSSEVIQLLANDIDESPNLSSDFEKEYITGIGKDGDRIIILLDLNKALSIPKSSSEIS